MRVDLKFKVLLAIRSTSGAVHRITFDHFSKRTNSDPENTQVACLDPVYTATNHSFIRTNSFNSCFIYLVLYTYI